MWCHILKSISTLPVTVQGPVLINGVWVQGLDVCNRLSYFEIRLVKHVITFHLTSSFKDINKSTTSMNL
jgi:hypothetical protein